jgi:type IV pilus assembly protein PilV
MTQRKIAARGFTLVEVMVAMAVLAVGLLGIAKLSLGTVQSNGSAFMRTQATELIQQIVDDMRANEPQAASGGYNITLGTNPGAAPACITGTCSAALIATFDLARWYTQLAALLPNGRGQVQVTQVNNTAGGNLQNQAVITVTWDDTVATQAFANGTVPGTTTQTVVMETLL